MTESNSPTPKQLDSLKAYRELSAEEKRAILDILSAVSDLELMRINGNSPSIEVIRKKATATGYPSIVLHFYIAKLKGNPQLV